MPELRERPLLLLIADISGYTKFMTAERDLELPLPPYARFEEACDDIGAVPVVVYHAPAVTPRALDSGVPRTPPAIFLDTLRVEIQREYADVATAPEKGFHLRAAKPRLAG